MYETLNLKIQMLEELKEKRKTGPEEEHLKD